ncbi:MAG: endolytic transglycosylase MltG [Candidatus Nanopelagicales bacterium]|nr:endolytic transglycosylase MltG [Candidatus Nanopelagicales bacterium]MDZ4249348.1 endolytic transglycosylase MltG [Candidatus Nanopelagicales bacterium]
MSNVGLPMRDSSSGGGGQDSRPSRPGGKRSKAAVVLAVIIVAALVGGVGYGGYKVYKSMRAEAPIDYPGPGQGSVVIEVKEGQILSEIGETLKEADVVASAEAFTQAAALDERATSITPGGYSMLLKMSAQGALERMLDPASSTDVVVVIPEGFRTYQTVDRLSASTGIPKNKFNTVIASPQLLPLPAWAKGKGAARAEGFLFPSTYRFDKKATPSEMLNEMVAKFTAVTTEIDFVGRAAKTGRSPYDVLNIASIVQAEGRPGDFGKVARVVYNRLSPKTWGGTYGYLGVDATLNYALGQFKIDLTRSELATNSPYNTSTEHRQGLPPTPIDSPGQEAMEAALDPPKGDWLYYATVNLKTGETKFTDNYNEFLRYQQELRDYLARHPE